MKRRLFLASFAVLAVAGCSSSSSGGSSNAGDTTGIPSLTATPTVSPSESPTASPTPSPSVTPSFPTTINATHKCTSSNLGVTIGQGQGAAGSTIIPLVFTNNGHQPCTLYGYPGVSFLNANEQQIGVDAVRAGSEEGVVTLAPGGAGNALLKVPDPGNFSPADCKQQTTTFILVYPPDETHSIETNESIPICTTSAGAVMVQPITPGNGD